MNEITTSILKINKQQQQQQTRDTHENTHKHTKLASIDSSIPQRFIMIAPHYFDENVNKLLQ